MVKSIRIFLCMFLMIAMMPVIAVANPLLDEMDALDKDKNYEEGDVMISLARFWHQLPWPLKDMKQSLKYYREYQATPFYGKDPNTMVLVADLLADMGGNNNKKEAKEILSVAMTNCGEYYTAIARDAMKKL
ncbi:MAG: hypothetical protein KJ737_18065 [Proteobacteria bacterium]|nr:hypothetical protein [Pseudomonadota bacterium]